MFCFFSELFVFRLSIFTAHRLILFWGFVSIYSNTHISFARELCLRCGVVPTISIIIIYSRWFASGFMFCFVQGLFSLFVFVWVCVLKFKMPIAKTNLSSFSLSYLYRRRSCKKCVEFNNKQKTILIFETFLMAMIYIFVKQNVWYSFMIFVNRYAYVVNDQIQCVFLSFQPIPFFSFVFEKKKIIKPADS